MPNKVAVRQKILSPKGLLSSESGRSTKSIEVVQSAISGRFTSDNG